MGNCLRNLILGSIAALALTACGGYSCRAPQVYQAARSVPPIEVPEDLEVRDDTSQRLVIPQAAEDAPARDPADPCLDEPPEFFGPEKELQ